MARIDRRVVSQTIASLTSQAFASGNFTDLTAHGTVSTADAASSGLMSSALTSGCASGTCEDWQVVAITRDGITVLTTTLSSLSTAWGTISAVSRNVLNCQQVGDNCTVELQKLQAEPSFSVIGMSRMGLSASVLDLLHLGRSLSVRGFFRR